MYGLVCLGPMSSEELAVKFRVWDQSLRGVSGSHLGVALQRGPWPTLVVQRNGEEKLTSEHQWISLLLKNPSKIIYPNKSNLQE